MTIIASDSDVVRSCHTRLLDGPQEVKFAEAGEESGDCSIGSLELNAGQCLRAELVTEGFVPLGGRDDPGLSDHPPGHTAA